MTTLYFGGAIIISAVGSGFLSYTIVRKAVKSKIKNIEKETSDKLEKSRIEAEDILRSSREKALRQSDGLKKEFERETKQRKRELEILEKRVSQREMSLDKKFSIIEHKEIELTTGENALKEKELRLANQTKECETLVLESRKQLSRIASMTEEEAKRKLMEMMLNEAKYDASKKIRQIETEATETAEKTAKKIIATSVQRYSGEYVSERAVTVVTLPSDDMKGRIIGREGRNIRALEALTGVDIIVDDTPEAIVLSCFHPIRRQIAKIAIEKLISDGRIHPARIEEIVKHAEDEIEDDIRAAGERAVFDLSIHGLHAELIRLVGALKYRYSYTQNQYQHSMEVAFIAGAIASEIGVDPKKAKRAALLHDIGKALTHELEGSHAVIGAEFAKKHNEPDDVCHAIGAHHPSENFQLETPLDFIILSADSLSGARPGARRESLEGYANRVKEIEDIANSFSGVDKSYAIQAGRELRVLVSSEKVNDDMAVVLSRDICKKVEKELTYPGEIKITVIRETRATSIAK